MIRDIILATGWAGAAGVLIYGAVALAERPYHAIRYRIDKRRGGDIESLAALVAAPGPVIHQCGCMPCPTHAAAQLARAKAAKARAEWAEHMHEETGL